MYIYLAGPIDFDNGAGARLRTEVKFALLESGVAFFDPSQPYGGAMLEPRAVRESNEAMITIADGMLALLPDGVPTIGTPMEIGSAYSAGKPVAVLGGKNSMQLRGMLGVEVFELDAEGIDAAIRWLGEQRVKWSTHARQLHAAPQFPIVHDFDPGYHFRGDAGQPVPLHVVETPKLQWTGDPEFEPRRTYTGDAGYDLIVSEDTYLGYSRFQDVPMGISIELPPDTWAMITGRSSTIRTRSLLVTQGIIDNGYRGPLFAGVQNLGPGSARVKRGERIAQLILFPLTAAAVELERVEALGDSDRGAAGFGSSGA